MNQVALLPEPDTLTPMQMLQIAVSKGVDTEQLKVLMELKRQWDTDRAREAFTEAMSKFRSEAIDVVKDKRVEFGNTKYSHATLAGIVNQIAPKLSEHGLSHRWETKQEGNAITVTCIVTHKLGHSISNSLTAPPDNSGSKNSIQAIGSAVTYLQRYTLLAITGLAAKDADDDGRSAQPAVAKITESQAADLGALIEEVNANRTNFLKFYNIKKLDELAAKDLPSAVAELNRKRK